MARNRTRLAAILALGMLLPSSSFAQGALDVSRLPVNLDRIQRQLREAAVREERDGLNLRYFVDVFGQAPPIEVFAPDVNLTTGPVPWSAPTHRQIIEHITPQEYRAPAADLGALFRWLAGKKDSSR